MIERISSYLELLPDLPADRLLDLLQSIRECTFWQIVGESILVTELIQHGVLNVIALQEHRKGKEHFD